MSLSVAGSALYDGQVDFSPPSLKDSYVLHTKLEVGKPVIIIDSCIFKSWFTTIYLQSVFLKLRQATI